MHLDLMEFLYRVMEELSNAGIPIVFKGAMVLNLVIRENNPSKVERMTRSGQNVCRRMKDVLDIYVMSFITKINTDELYQIWRETDRELGDFEAYKTQIAELSETYNKMKGIKNKPDFIEVYNCVNDIVSCFECQREKTYY